MMEEPLPASSPINKRRRRATEEDTNKVLHDEDVAFVSGDFSCLQILDRNSFLAEDPSTTNTIRRNFEEEIEAALRDVSFGVQKIQRLQSSGNSPIPKDVFLFQTKKNKKNITELSVDNFEEPLVEIITLENKKYVIACSRSGFQVI